MLYFSRKVHEPGLHVKCVVFFVVVVVAVAQLTHVYVK